MKKFFYLATALVALASCTSEEMVNDSSPQGIGGQTPILFNNSVGTVTRADLTPAESVAALENNFVVEGAKGLSSFASTVVFDNYNVNYVSSSANTTTSNTKGWEYVGQNQNIKGTSSKLSAASAQTIKYWDYSQDQYDFVAFSLGEGDKSASPVTYATATAITPSTIGTSAFTLTGTAAQLEKCYVSDIETVLKTNYGNVVTLRFRSFSAKIRLALYETIPGYSVKDVKFYTADGATSSTTAALYSGTSMPKEGTYTVYYPNLTNSSLSDYKRPHVSYAAKSGSTASDITFKELGTKLGYTGKELAEAEGNHYLGRTSNTASFAYTTADKEYFTVMPNEAGQEFKLKVDYTLVSTDGSGEVINVTGATAKVPANYTRWASNYAYTYLFKISQDTNGTTGGDVVGLYPIVFDAVVSTDEVANVETITTVSEPSITTYALGVNPTSGSEYPKSVNIYITVPGVDLTSSNANLYKVTIDAGAAQTINEASVANCIAQSGTVTDANGKTMAATLSNQDSYSNTILSTGIDKIAASDTPDNREVTLSNNAARINANKAVAGTYAFEYTKAAVSASYVHATGTYVSGKTYYTDNTGTTPVNTSSFTASTDVSSYYVLETPASPAAKYYKIIIIHD